MALPTFDELMAQAAKHVVTPQPDPALIQAMTRNSQERQVNMPIALGAMLSGDRGMQGVGGLMYKDAREANNLIPLGDEGFIDPTSGTFMASPVAQSRRQQRVLDLAMRQANSNDQKMLSAANAAASREQAQLLRQAQIEREDAYRKEQLEIQRQNADTRAVAAAAAAEAAKARADAAAQGARIPRTHSVAAHSIPWVTSRRGWDAQVLTTLTKS
jgi:cell division septum initiation protein DivIVA